MTEMKEMMEIESSAQPAPAGSGSGGLTRCGRGVPVRPVLEIGPRRRPARPLLPQADLSGGDRPQCPSSPETKYSRRACGQPLSVGNKCKALREQGLPAASGLSLVCFRPGLAWPGLAAALLPL